MRKRLFVGPMSIIAALLVSACAAQQQADVPAAPPPPVVAAHPGTTAAGNFLAGRFAEDQHDLTAAAAFLRGAERADPEQVEVLQRTYLALAADGQLSDASEVAVRVLKYDNDAAIAAVLVTEQLVRTGQWAAAERRIQGLPKRGFNQMIEPLMAAWIEMGQGHVDQALSQLEPLKSDGHQIALYEYHAALICDLADRKADAEQHYRAALAAEGGEVLRAVQAAVSFYRRTGAPESANDIVHRYRLAHADHSLVDFDSTARPIDSARAGVAEALFAMAGTLRQGGANDLALIFARLTLDLEPDFALTQLLAGDLLQDMGRLDAANEMYGQIGDKDAARWAAQLRIANNYDQLLRFDDAVHVLETAATQHPDRADALVELGDLLRRHERWTEAIAAYDRALALVAKPGRGDWPLYYARGIAEHEADQWPRAQEDFEHALALNPDQPDVLNYLGYSWVEKGVNLDRAKEMIEKALSQRPTSGFMVDSLGWLFFRMGQYDKAVAEMERAIELTPDDATINSHLGDTLAAVGRIEEARYQWKRALIYNPDPELKAELERKLRDGFKPPPPIRPSRDAAAQ